MSSIVEITHEIRPLTPTMFDRYVDVHRDQAVPFLEQIGAELLGVFKWSTGPMGRYLTLLRVEQHDASNAPPGAESPAGIPGGGLAAAMDGTGMTISETVRTTGVVPFATEERLRDALESAGPDGAPRQYMIARLGVTAAGRPLTYELIAQLAESFGARGRMRLVTAYHNAIGATHELTDLWVMDRLGDLRYRPSSPSALVDELRTVAPDESIDYLNPLPHSPLR